MKCENTKLQVAKVTCGFVVCLRHVPLGIFQLFIYIEVHVDVFH